MMNKFLRLLFSPYYLLGVIYNHFVKNYIKDDRTFIKWDYYFAMHTFPDLDNPKTFNEKLQWLKLNDKRPEYTRMVDKYEAKEYVKNIIGDKYVIPTIGVWESFDDINFENLPNQFVLKTTHDSGGVVICRDKLKFDIKKAKKKIKKSLRHNFYNNHREYPYKNVKPRIIAEKFMVDESGFELKDYKFFCFNGMAKFFKVDFDRSTCHRANYYDLNFNLLEFGEVICPPNKLRTIEKPNNFHKMVELAEILSKSIPFVRVDFYNIDGDIYWGELTFFPASGNGAFCPSVWDYKIGNLIDLKYAVD